RRCAPSSCWAIEELNLHEVLRAGGSERLCGPPDGAEAADAAQVLYRAGAAARRQSLMREGEDADGAWTMLRTVRLFHFSDDPAIARFVPRPVRTPSVR